MRTQPCENLAPYFLTLDELGCFLTLDELGCRIDWQGFFGNSHPVELDVGCGRGLFLVRSGGEHPEVNFLGLELDFREARRAARRLSRRRLLNVRVLGGDALVVLRKYIRTASVAAVHVYFPDPWWKRRHRRRRLFSDVFVEQTARVLQPGGELHAWTDVADYFAVMQALLDHDPRFERLPPPPERRPTHDMDYHTSFERNLRKAGCTIHRGRWRRIDDRTAFQRFAAAAPPASVD